MSCFSSDPQNLFHEYASVVVDYRRLSGVYGISVHIKFSYVILLDVDIKPYVLETPCTYFCR